MPFRYQFPSGIASCPYKRLWGVQQAGVSTIRVQTSEQQSHEQHSSASLCQKVGTGTVYDDVVGYRNKGLRVWGSMTAAAIEPIRAHAVQFEDVAFCTGRPVV